MLERGPPQASTQGRGAGSPHRRPTLAGAGPPASSIVVRRLCGESVALKCLERKPRARCKSHPELSGWTPGPSQVPRGLSAGRGHMGPAPHPSPLGDARSPGVADGLRSRTLLQFPGGPAGISSARGAAEPVRVMSSAPYSDQPHGRWTFPTQTVRPASSPSGLWAASRLAPELRVGQKLASRSALNRLRDDVCL